MNLLILASSVRVSLADHVAEIDSYTEHCYDYFEEHTEWVPYREISKLNSLFSMWSDTFKFKSCKDSALDLILAIEDSQSKDESIIADAIREISFFCPASFSTPLCITAHDEAIVAFERICDEKEFESSSWFGFSFDIAGRRVCAELNQRLCEITL